MHFLFSDVHSANEKKSADDVGAKQKMISNNNAYDNPSLQVIDETDPSLVGAVAAPSSQADGKQTVVDGKAVSTAVDDTIIKKLVREEADRIMRQNP